MENTPHEGKENTSEASDFQINFSMIHGANLQLLHPNIQKKLKLKVKPQKGFSSNLRAGDWVCLVCNNLNFSFRNECNRCQIQTKEQNKMQSLYISDNQNSQARPPLTDLTNQKYNQQKSGAPGFHSKSKSTPMQSDLNLALLGHPISILDTNGPIENGGTNLEFGPNSPLNHGFQNKLLVTPPKHRQNKSLNIFKEYSDSSQKELPPYKSPEHLPSISPILKKVFGYDFKAIVDKNGKLHQSSNFLKEEVEEREQRQEGSREDLYRTKEMNDKYSNDQNEQGPFGNVSLRIMQVNGHQMRMMAQSSSELADQSKFFSHEQERGSIEKGGLANSFGGNRVGANNGNFEQ